MIRPLLIEFGIFIIPFALYAAFLIATRAGRADPEALAARTRRGLTAARCVLVVVGFVLFADFSGAPPGSTYVPAHIENGKFVPGASRNEPTARALADATG